MTDARKFCILALRGRGVINFLFFIQGIVLPYGCGEASLRKCRMFVGWGLSNRSTIQYTETFHTSHQDFPLAAPLLLSNSLADDVFDPPTSLGFRYAPPIGIFPVAKLNAGIDVCCYVLASLFEGCFHDIVAQLSRFYWGSSSNRTVRQRPQCRLDFVPQETVIPEARILDDEQCNSRESGGPAPCGFLCRSCEAGNEGRLSVYRRRNLSR